MELITLWNYISGLIFQLTVKEVWLVKTNEYGMSNKECRISKFLYSHENLDFLNFTASFRGDELPGDELHLNA